MIEQYTEISEKQLAQIESFYEMHKNAELNLTAIKDRDDFYRKHVLDSFLIYKEHPKLLKGPVADIGTGGGFPGIILAIIYPGIRFTLVDSIAKKCRFVQKCAEELKLENVEVLTARAEEIKGRKFKTILSRGVAKTDQIIKFTANLAEKDTVWVLYKGENADEELKDAKSILNKNMLEFENVRYEAPFQRTYIVLHDADRNSRLY